MFNMVNTNSEQLSQFIDSQLRRRGWSLRTLAMYAELSPAALSNLLRGRVQPSTETLRKIAEVLEVDEATLLKMAGHLEDAPRGLQDGAVIALAQRIEGLPKETRGKALEALGAMLDTIYQVSAPPPPPRGAQEGLDAAIVEEIEEAVRRGDEESMFTLAVDLLAKYRPDILKAAAAELLAQREREQRQSPPVADPPRPD